MDDLLDALGGIALVLGACFVLLAGIGAVRFRDTYARMHAAAKAPALGVLLIGVGTALTIRTTPAVISCFLVVVLQLIAGTVGTHIMGRSVYRIVAPPLSGPDELAEAEATLRDDRPGEAHDERSE
jgi:multicomponent Na+:H+ antiporter subunit G